jgi:hypothetical protein
VTAAAVPGNREAWLLALVDALRPWFAEHGFELPPFRIACGFPSSGGLGSRRRTVGECWPPNTSTDGTAEVFVSPTLDDPVEVAETTVHELLHAVVGCDKGHGPVFAAAARAMLLEGPPTATRSGDAFRQKVEPILAVLGPYPHARLSPEPKTKPQSTRLLKASCAQCGYVVRVTAKHVVERGAPCCPEHGPMNVEGRGRLPEPPVDPEADPELRADALPAPEPEPPVDLSLSPRDELALALGFDPEFGDLPTWADLLGEVRQLVAHT